MEPCDIAVIGAGAAGLTAAIFAADTARQQRGPHALPRIVVLDGAKTIGAKILVSGGGRCNVTHAEVTPADFNGSRNIVRNVLAAFDGTATRRWLASLGVELKREDSGKLFPVTDSARTVLEALLRRCMDLDVSVRPRHRVSVLRRGPLPAQDPAPFILDHASGRLSATRVILATGGRSLPRTGSDGGGWDLARSCGHSVTDTYPALVPLVLRAGMFHRELSGLSQPVALSVFADGTRIDHQRGSMLWTHFGISGPVVLDVSRHWVLAQARGQRVELRCNFLPGWDFEQTDAWLRSVAAQRPRLSLGRCLADRLAARLALALAQSAGCAAATPVAQLTREQRRQVVHACTDFLLPVERDRGWNYAEVTAGGVPLEEVDYRTMESRKAPGLHLAGEMLACDGRIGGFNFQWAWATGYLAGRAAASGICANARAARRPDSAP
ncbi:MAG: putative Oxidoreductase with FAD/NAD(P)-binding domain [Deltaproteobacteria bacterium]|nr:putative Oxidoreductase with FAD/NAD(P)-binding domain [Deltaproteobacteria bacterium]